MTRTLAARGLLLICVICLSGCIGAPIKFDDLTSGGTTVGYAIDSSKKPYDSVNSARCTLAPGGPLTTQGHALCNSLIRVSHRQNEVQRKFMTLGDERFDYSLIFLATASAAALAAESHISALQALGIGTAAALGLKNYAAVPARRSIYALGNSSLSCVREASEALLWDDRWYFSLRKYRGTLNRAHAKMTQYASSLGTTDPLYAKYEALNRNVGDSLTLADDAVSAYSSLSTIVDAKRVELIATMRDRVDNSRADINSIVASIQNAQAVKAVQNDAVDDKAETVVRTAAENSVNPAELQLLEQIATEAESIPDSTNPQAASESLPASLSKLDTGDNSRGLKNSMATAAYAMQRIANIAPRYIKAKNNVNACIYP